MRPGRFFRLASWLAVLALVVTLALSPGYAGSSGSGPAPTSVSEAVNSGVAFEVSKKWVDAIVHYEKALKLWPDNKDLEYGLRRSKIQFSVERRYSDNTFHKSLLSLPKHEALNLFSDVWDRIQGQYVENVTATSFVAHGTESLYLALTNARFQQSNIPSRNRANVERLRETLRNEFWNKPVTYREEAQAIVSRICQLGAEQLASLRRRLSWNTFSAVATPLMTTAVSSRRGATPIYL